MWRGPLNSDTLATTTYRKLERVSDGTSTQVRARMINRCRMSEGPYQPKNIDYPYNDDTHRRRFQPSWFESAPCKKFWLRPWTGFWFCLNSFSSPVLAMAEQGNTLLVNCLVIFNKILSFI